MSMSVNPGSGPVRAGTLENAERNMRAFCDDATARYERWFRFRHIHQDDGGRWAFEVECEDGRVVRVDMPGLDLARVRWMSSEDGDIWEFPRLLVDGASWIWTFALGALFRGGESS